MGRKTKRMKCEDNMLGLVAQVKGCCLTEKWFKRYIMGREKALPVTKEISIFIACNVLMNCLVFSNEIKVDPNYFN